MYFTKNKDKIEKSTFILRRGFLTGQIMDSLMKSTERLYLSGDDFTINLIPAALVTVALLGCELTL